jgi:hypothetical protein
VTRAKPNLKTHRVYSAQTDRTSGVIADQTIALDGQYAGRDYPVHFRRVRFKDPKTGKTPRVPDQSDGVAGSDDLRLI